MLQHVSDHKGSIIRDLYTVLGKNFSKGSLSSVVMNVVSVMAAYLPMVRVCTAQSRDSRDYGVVGVMAAYLPVVCVCVCVLHSLERHCVYTAQCREALCVYCTV